MLSSGTVVPLNDARGAHIWLLPVSADLHFHRPHPNANDVHVTGTFDDWGKSEKLNKVGDVWEKEVDLSKADEKILYKFVVDDNWVIDHTAPQEDDGHGNVNNVLYPTDIKSKPAVVPEALTTSSAAPESTTAVLAGGVPLEPRKEATEGKTTCDTSLEVLIANGDIRASEFTRRDKSD